MNHADNAIALLVVTTAGRRYFHGFGRKGQLLGAWSLAGATLFGPWQDREIEAVEARLLRKGYEPERVMVRMLGSDLLFAPTLDLAPAARREAERAVAGLAALGRAVAALRFRNRDQEIPF